MHSEPSFMEWITTDSNNYYYYYYSNYYYRNNMAIHCWCITSMMVHFNEHHKAFKDPLIRHYRQLYYIYNKAFTTILLQYDEAEAPL